jgi:hypothetical protein
MRAGGNGWNKTCADGVTGAVEDVLPLPALFAARTVNV